MIRTFSFWLFFLVIISESFGQHFNLGTPFIHSYPKDIYKAGAQSWDIALDSRGATYFANNNGLLYYDGDQWKTYPLPNGTIVRSVAVAPNGEIYAGGQNEFGKFIPDSTGRLVYQSLKSLIPESHQGFEDVWDIAFMESDVFFRASQKVYQLKKESCQVYDDYTFEFLGRVDKQIVAQDLDVGLLYYDEGQFNKLDGSDILKGKLVSDILAGEQTSIITTYNEGLFLIGRGGIGAWETDADEFLKQNHITSASRAQNGMLALGTDFAGVLIMDNFGTSHFHIDRQSSLINNKVFTLDFDLNQNLWVGVDNGINYLELNSPFTRIFPDGDLEGAGHAVRIFDDKIYFGTSNGLYSNDWKKHYDPFVPPKFSRVSNTKGQTWDLEIVNDQLMLGHNLGAFRITGEQAVPIYDEAGVWNFEQLEAKPDYMISGTYKNFVLYNNLGGSWIAVNDFENWFESCRFVEQDDRGNVWVSHPYKGVFRVQFNEVMDSLLVKKYGSDAGLPDDLHNHLFKINNEILVCGKTGIYSFLYEKEIFIPNSQFDEIFGKETKTRRLSEAPNGDIWFINNEKLGVLNVEDRGLDKKIEKLTFPEFKNQLNAGFESIYSVDNYNVFITNDKGFIHYNPSFQPVQAPVFSTILNEVRLSAGIDSLIFGGFDGAGFEMPELKAYENALKFRFAATDYSAPKSMRYRFYLEGSEAHWSEWTEINVKEYTNLPPGQYVFMVEAKNHNGIVSKATEFAFEIMAPWYATKAALSLYVLLFLVAAASGVMVFRRKYYGLKSDRDQTIKASKEAIGKLKQEKVQAELEFKQRELVSTAMHVVQKNETLGKVKEQLIDLKKLNRDSGVSKEIQKMINMLQQDEIIDDGWQQFMMHFNQLHGGYYDRLKSKYPDLTPKDLKMCTYLRMNLSTKEMASLLNVTTRGIEASRYRLRKKLKLGKEDNLTEHLMHI